MKYFILFIAIICFLILPVQALELVKVIDGDTLKLSNNGEVYNFRIKGIDCFETSLSDHAFRQAYLHNWKVEDVKAYGVYIKAHLQKYLQGKKLDAKIIGKGDYKRPIGYLFVNDNDLGLYLLENGYCEQSYQSKYRTKKYSQEYNQAEKYAKNQKMGIWKKYMNNE